MEFLREVLSYDPRLLAQFLALGIVVYAMLKAHLSARVAALEAWRKEAEAQLVLLPTIDQRTKDMFDLIKAHFSKPETLVMTAARVGSDLIESPHAEALAREWDRLKGSGR